MNYSFTRLRGLVVIVVFASLVGLFFQPHVRSEVFGMWTRPEDMRKFITRVQTEKSIDIKQFWEFRETYAPGSFTFADEVAFHGTQVLQELPPTGMPLHTFSSRHLVSKDFVVPIDTQRPRSEQARDFLRSQLPLPSQEQIVYADDANLIFWNDEGQRVIFFYRPIEELYLVNGLFDFTEEERNLLQDTFWVNITVVK